jgi:hypothetical protein
MNETRAPYLAATNEQTPPVGNDLHNFWRRLLKLQRGRMYNVIIQVPDGENQR